MLCLFQVWIVYGDGSLGYSIAEFDTFTRHKVKSHTILFRLHVIYGSKVANSSQLDQCTCGLKKDLMIKTK